MTTKELQKKNGNKVLNKHTPTLRFPNFTDDWEEKKLGEISKFWNGKAHEQDISENGYIVVNSKFISTNGEVKKYSDKQISPLFKDDITIVMSDIPNGKALAKCFLIDADNKYTLNQRIGRIKSDEVFSNFLIRVLNRNKYYLKFNNGVSQTNLRKSEVLGCPIIFPSKPEQEKIASFLGGVDDWLGNLKKQKEELEKYKKGIMQQIFPAKDQKTPALRFPNFTGDWEEKKLGGISSIYDGTHQTPKYVKEGVPFYSVEHLTANNFSNTKFISKDVFNKEIKRVMIEKNDILMTRIGDIGTSKLIDWDVKASFYVSLSLIKISKSLESQFLNQYIKTDFFQRELWKRTIHVAFPKKINLGEIGHCFVHFPKKPEQEKIASFLNSLDDKINSTEQKITALEKWKKGLMQKMFV